MGGGGASRKPEAGYTIRGVATIEATEAAASPKKYY